MTFAAPQFLWALLVLPVLWWLSQPPKPRRTVLTAHMQQWQLAMRALKRRPPRGSWLRFVLLAIATIAATLAAARPSLPATPGPNRLVVLLDASASMAAAVEPEGPSAFDRAKSRLRDRFDELPEHVEVTVLRCGGPLRRRHGRAARSLQDLGKPGGRLEVDLAALAERTATEDCAVWTLTDGQGQERLPEVGALTRFDTSGDNAVLEAVRVVDAWPLPNLRLEVDVVAHARTGVGDRIRAELRVRGAVRQEQAFRLSLQSGVRATRTIDLVRTKAGGELVVELAMPGDRLPDDHRYRCTLPPLPAPRIATLVESDAQPFAQVAAESLAEEVGGKVVAPSASEPVGMLLVDGGVVPLLDERGELLGRRALTFGTRLAESVASEVWPAPAPLQWSRRSPLTVGLDLSELRVDRAWRGILPEGEPFLWHEDGGERAPLAVVVDHGETASMHFAFRLEDSNLPLLPAFPQLLRRAFVRSYGAAAIRQEVPPRAPVGERDLSSPAAGEDRGLPDFGGPERPQAAWFVLAGLLALALRAFVR